ncbi:MAG TPA: hypothetical protein VKN99_15990, partial [Polyangia bacterium]|nr:hypothetical protein [Polyangia bacterium]
RLAALLTADAAPDVREQVGELALLVQRLVEHRRAAVREQVEIDLVTEPLERLVSLVERHVHTLLALDRERATLDESAMVRALAASDARREPPAARRQLLEGLDRLRALEDARAALFARLLESASLLRRCIELGLRVRNQDAVYANEFQAALVALEGALGTG